MEQPTDYYAYRANADRVAELHREADAFRLTRVLADLDAAANPRSRRLGAGVIGLGRRTPAVRRRRPSSPRPAAVGRGAASPQPCPC